MKNSSFSGLALASALLVSCTAGDSDTDAAGGNDLLPVVIDPAAAKTGFLFEMQGGWVSDEDPKTTILVEGSSFQTFQDGALQDDVPIIFVDSCKTQVPDMTGKAFILRGKEKQTCYLFYSVSEEKLSYIDGTRGRTSRFTRKE